MQAHDAEWGDEEEELGCDAEEQFEAMMEQLNAQGFQ
jgi:hypothetical protein